MPTLKYDAMLREFDDFARSANSVTELMQHIAQQLHEGMSRYNWVGFYLMEDSSPPALVVGPYFGSFIPLERITLDQGLCGAAATAGRTVVVNNVAADPRYIGFDTVKSNIVVPIFVKKKVAAELDVESYFAEAFPLPEQTFLESCAAIVGRAMEAAGSKRSV